MNIFNDIVSAVEKVEWNFESHDPVWAWLIVGMYSFAALVCLRALFYSQRSLFPDKIKKKCKIFWVVLFLIMLFLACNKQLDIQTYITSVGREVAHIQGWYDDRRVIQKEVVITLGLVAFLFLFYLFYIVFNLPTANKIAMVGALFTFIFIGMRASSFHHLDHYVGRTVFGVKIHILIEICGGVIVSLGALLSVKTLSKWELYYDKNYKSAKKHGIINTDFNFDSDLDSDSEIAMRDNIIDDDTRLDVINEPYNDTKVKVTMNNVINNNIKELEKSEIRDSDTILQHDEKKSLAELVSGKDDMALNDKTKVDLFQKVSNPEYAKKSKTHIDNSSPRVSREKLSEVNRKRREFEKSVQETEYGKNSTSKQKVSRDNSWITRSDETGWI